eukprot:TRINITY_DN3306_c0_g1_i3.p1 TRINITY_DN3306_c0_g1~~TRINITY_DN3306_c0_g1_i3.p1  ORF type:complete len:385 (-),score=128.93 TRINITY_DN3306_c0_g1_i3:204-1358(-)
MMEFGRFPLSCATSSMHDPYSSMPIVVGVRDITEDIFGDSNSMLSLYDDPWTSSPEHETSILASTFPRPRIMVPMDDPCPSSMDDIMPGHTPRAMSFSSYEVTPSPMLNVDSYRGDRLSSSCSTIATPPPLFFSIESSSAAPSPSPSFTHASIPFSLSLSRGSPPGNYTEAPTSSSSSPSLHHATPLTSMFGPGLNLLFPSPIMPGSGPRVLGRSFDGAISSPSLNIIRALGNALGKPSAPPPSLPPLDGETPPSRNDSTTTAPSTATTTTTITTSTIPASNSTNMTNAKVKQQQEPQRSPPQQSKAKDTKDKGGPQRKRRSGVEMATDDASPPPPSPPTPAPAPRAKGNTYSSKKSRKIMPPRDVPVWFQNKKARQNAKAADS